MRLDFHRSFACLASAGLLMLACSKPQASPEFHRASLNLLSLEAFLQQVELHAQGVAGSRRLRLAVMPLCSTDSRTYVDKGFGGFITEKISTALGKPTSPVRLFERARLDAVLQEQKLSSTGLFNESDAKRLGELAPIDLLLTGTFTRLEDRVDLNLRFIDVITGEVRGSLSESLALDPAFAGLFESLGMKPLQVSVREVREQAPGCEPRWTTVRSLEDELQTQDKVERCVEAAMAFPFEGPCGEIHYEVMHHLLRYKRSSDAYADFLVKTLESMSEEDGRAREIPHFLLARGPLNDRAWNALFRIAARSRRFGSYLEYLLADPVPSASSRSHLQVRINTVLAKVESREVGRPVPLELGQAFTEVLESLRHLYFSSYQGAQDVEPLLACYRRHAAKFADPAEPRLMSVLKDAYGSAKSPSLRGEVIDHLAERIRLFPVGRPLADSMAPFVDKLYDQRQKGQGEARERLDRMMKGAGSALAQAIPHIVGREYRLLMTGLCLEAQVQAPTVPTLEALMNQLAEPGPASHEPLYLMSFMGSRALPAERLVLKALRRTEHASPGDSQNIYVQRDLLKVLGTMQTRNPEVHRVLLTYLRSLESLLSDTAISALASIGEPAADFLKAELPRQEAPYLQMRILKVFQLRGPSAERHLPWLQNLATHATSPHVQDAAEDAMAAIRLRPVAKGTEQP